MINTEEDGREEGGNDHKCVAPLASCKEEGGGIEETNMEWLVCVFGWCGT